MNFEDALTKDDREITALLFREFDKPERLRAFGEVSDHLSDRCYWSLLSELLRRNESLYRDQSLLRKLLQCGRPEKSFLMSVDEYKKFYRLPKLLTIYRGAWLDNAAGWSWTLTRGKAKWYANRCPYDGKPLLIKGRVKKELIEAYFGAEDHDEIFVSPNRVRIVTTIKLPEVQITQSQRIFQQVQAGFMLETDDIRIGLQASCMRINVKGNIEKAFKIVDERIESLTKWGFVEKVEALGKLRRFVLEPPPAILALEEVQHAKGETSTA